MNKRDVECYLQSFVQTFQESDGGWTWGVQDTIGHPAGWLREPTNQRHPTQKDALDAGLAYCWACQPKLIASARHEAEEAAKYQAAKKRA